MPNKLEFPDNYTPHTYTKNYSFLIWKSNISKHPVFYLVTLCVQDPLSPLLLSVPRGVLEARLNLEVPPPIWVPAWLCRAKPSSWHRLDCIQTDYLYYSHCIKLMRFLHFSLWEYFDEHAVLKQRSSFFSSHTPVDLRVKLKGTQRPSCPNQSFYREGNWVPNTENDLVIVFQLWQSQDWDSSFFFFNLPTWSSLPIIQWFFIMCFLFITKEWTCTNPTIPSDTIRSQRALCSSHGLSFTWEQGCPWRQWHITHAKWKMADVDII